MSSHYSRSSLTDGDEPFFFTFRWLNSRKQMIYQQALRAQLRSQDRLLGPLQVMLTSDICLPFKNIQSRQKKKQTD